MKDDTKLIHLARASAASGGTVNLPVHRASTILYPDLDAYVHRFDGDERYSAGDLWGWAPVRPTPAPSARP